MPKYLYRVLDHCSESTYTVESYNGSKDGTWIAKDAAENYHFQHDGWESRWPLTFQILDYDEHDIGKYNVDRDVAPVFYAAEIKETK